MAYSVAVVPTLGKPIPAAGNGPITALLLRCAPYLGEAHRMNFRVQGAVCSYALELSEKGLLRLCKNRNGYEILMECSSLGNWKMAFPHSGARGAGNPGTQRGKELLAVHGWGCPLSQRLYRRFCSRRQPLPLP